MKRVRYLIIGICLAGLLSACGTVELPAATPIPTQNVWLVAYSSELAWLVEDFDDCLDPAWNSSLVIQEYQGAPAAVGGADILLHWGDADPQEYIAYQIGSDEVGLAVNPQNGLDKISADALRAIYTGEIRDWSEIDAGLTGEIHPWVYPEHLAMGQAFAAGLGGLEPVSPYANIAPDVKAMIQALEEDPLAIGFLPGLWPASALKEIRADGWQINPVPLVALAEDENPLIAAWLGCLSKSIVEE